MSDLDPRPVPVVSRTPTAGSSLYVTVGALVVVLLVGGYVMLGMPGLHTQVAHMPGQQSVASAPDK
jgi:hypothetical protein